MAKKKEVEKPSGRTKAAEPAKPAEKVSISGFKESAEFAAWFTEFNQYTLIPKAVLQREGLKLLAAKKKFRPPPD